MADSVTRSRSYLDAEAIEEYLNLHEWQIQGIQAGLNEVTENFVVDLKEAKREWGLSLES